MVAFAVVLNILTITAVLASAVLWLPLKFGPADEMVPILKRSGVAGFVQGDEQE